ncbi:Metastasis suppressor protein 1 [Sparganum proliferum]
MSSADLGKCVELTTLYSSLLSDIKSGSSLWEDVITRGGKLSAILRTTGGSKEIGASLTRLCMRQKRLGTKLKSMSNQLVTSLANPLSSRLDDWKRTVSQIEKQHSRDAKRARAELKRAVAEANRLQRKLSKHESSSRDSSGIVANQGVGPGVGLGQPPPPQPPSRPTSTSRGSRAFATTSSLAVQVEAAFQAIEDKVRRLEDVERASIRRLMLAERGRYCFFFDSLKPTLESETSMLGEISTLQDLLQALSTATEHPDQLLDEAEAILARAGSRGGNAHRSPRTGTALAAPVLGDKTSQEDAFAAAAAAIIFNRKQHHPQQQQVSGDVSADCTTSGQSSEGGNIVQTSACQAVMLGSSISDQNSLSAYSGSTNSTGGFPVAATHSSAVLRNGFASSGGGGCGYNASSQVSMPIDSVSSASSGPHLSMFSSQSQQHSCQGANLRSASVDRQANHQSVLNKDGRAAAVILRRPNTGTPAPVSDAARALTMFCTSSAGPTTSTTNSALRRDPLTAASMYNESLESCCTTTACSTIHRYSTTTLQPPAPLRSNDEAGEEEEATEEEGDDEENEGYVTDGDATADSEGDITSENVAAATVSGHLSATGSLKSGRHTISSTYDRALAGPKRTPISALTAERRSVSRSGDTNAMLYPEQSLPPPVYTNLNQLADAAQRKFSMSTSSCSSGVAAAPAKSSTAVAAGSITVHQRQISPVPQPTRSEDTVSIASAPARQPSGAGTTPCVAPCDCNISNGVAASAQPAPTLLHSAPGSPRHRLLPLNADPLQSPTAYTDDKRRYTAASQHPNSAPPMTEMVVALGGSVISNSVSVAASEDPFSLEMDELDRMVAGSSGASSTVAIGSSTPRSARSSSRQTDVSTGGRISARPLSQHSVTGFPNHHTGVPTGLQGEPNRSARRRSLSRGAATAVAVSGEHPVTLEIAKPARPLSTVSASTGVVYDDPAGHLETPNVATADEVVPSKHAATPSSSPPPPPPPPLMNNSHRKLDSADLDQTLVAATGQVYSSAPSRPRFSDSRLPSNDEDDIDVRASNVASTAACLLSQLSGQLQQLNTAGLCTSSQISADAPADPEFDLPAPPSPKQLHYL